MQIVQLIEDKRIKPAIFTLGVLITLAAIFGSFYGLVIGYNGIITGQPWLIVLGVTTILALLGIIGAWLRYSNNLSAMSSSQRARVRLFLICGIVASVYFAVGSFYLGFKDGAGWQFGLFFLSFTLGAGVFLYATPKEF
jgi:hypothetical protein